MKKMCAIALTCLVLMALPGCAWTSPEETKNDGIFRITLIPDIGGVNDKSFNESAWEGLCELAKENPDIAVNYRESKQTADFALNLDSASDQNVDLIIATGFELSDDLLDTAEVNLDKNYALFDYSYGDKTPNNITCVKFRAEESSFLVGYIAGKITKTNKLGFIGGMKNPIIYQFDYGFRAGALVAAKEMNKKIDFEVQYANSFSDCAKGKAIANGMYARGCDIIFHAAGPLGEGSIEAAADLNKLIIGVDRDQAYLAPNNVLTSAMKNVGQAVKIVAKKIKNGENLGGQTLVFGIKDGCVGIPEPGNVLPREIYNDAVNLGKTITDSIVKINDKMLKIPEDEASYKNFIEELEKV